jgi:hypothetical protein
LLLLLLLLWTLPRWLVKGKPENRDVFIVDILMCTSNLQIELCHLYFWPHNTFYKLYLSERRSGRCLVGWWKDNRKIGAFLLLTF